MVETSYRISELDKWRVNTPDFSSDLGEVSLAEPTNRIDLKDSSSRYKYEYLNGKYEGLDGKDLFFIYKNDVSKGPHLTLEEESDCTKKIKAYRVLLRSEDLSQSNLTQEEKEGISKKMKEGKAVENFFIKANLGLVINLARRYTDQGLDFLDLVQEGNIGLMKTVDKFDPDLGYRFSTYAAWKIKKEIRQAILDKGRVIRLPAYLGERINKLRKVEDVLMQEMGRFPTNQELSEYSGLSILDVEKLKRYDREVFSLDCGIGDVEDGNNFEEVLVSGGPTPVEIVEEKEGDGEMINTIRKALDDKRITSRWRRFATLFFGLDGSEPLKPKEIAIHFNVNKQRVSDLKKTIFRHLRDDAPLQQLLERV